MNRVLPRTVVLRLLACAGICLVGITPLLAQTTVSLPAAKDTMIFQNNVNNGSGGGPGFFAGTNSALSPRRGLISFDLSSIPTNATITSVQLQLYIGMIAGSGGGTGPGGTTGPTVNLHKLLIDWGEGTTDSEYANNTNLNGRGQGSPALPGDATWSNRYQPTTTPAGPATPWGQPGGQAGVDYVSAFSASLVLNDTLNAPAFWLSTPSLVADVQGWLANPASNNGWMLINADETGSQTFRGFYSSEFAPGGVASALRPALLVTYAVPEPTSITLCLIGASLVWLRRRTTIA